ncbi:MAG: hypothetical protein NZ772_17410 [Cyanobacteria bacterium]|nr:hypothetical protein [Cyanobacteriota bacterium]MDW8203071.1 hypothetical protein [Cyanobacteriota bacterium SKYGB_h_bin112]
MAIPDQQGYYEILPIGIFTIGTGGALVLAKRHGSIPLVATAIQQVRDAGL